MQTRSIDGSGEPVWVIAPSSAGLRLGPDPRKALWPAAMHAAQTGRTHDRTDQCCSNVKKALANQAPSTHDPCCVKTHTMRRRVGQSQPRAEITRLTI